VKTGATTVKDTGVTGTWSVLENQELRFTLNIGSTDLINFSSFAMHWGETCQNDVIEGVTRVVPAPGTAWLMAPGLGALLLLRRRRNAAAVAK
jgi:hypothetical protein